MTPEERREVNRLFREACDLPRERRERFLAEACQRSSILAEVKRLLKADAEASAFLERQNRDEALPDETEAAADMRQPSLPEESFGLNTEHIRGYRILGTLGAGGMGVVYLAEQYDPFRRRVALKVIKLGMDTRDVIARFEAEKQALALMNHPNIAGVFDAGATEDGRPYFAMEYVPGSPINEYSDRHMLSVRDRLAVFVQICEGVEHAHRRGVIHRDLKPSNILVGAPDNRILAKIIDFGIAKAINRPLTDTTIYTEVGRAVGTPAYMSPEQADLTAEDVDHRTDVYSLGVVLYELLVGELPLDWGGLLRANSAEISRRIREDDPPTPSTRWSRLSVERRAELAAKRAENHEALKSELQGDLDWICMKAIEKDRSRRYSRASDLAEDITRHIQNERVSVGPPSPVYRLKRFAKRRRVFLRMLCTAFVVACGSCLLFLLSRGSGSQLQVSDVLVSHDWDSGVCELDFRVYNPGRSEISINGCSFEVLSIRTPKLIPSAAFAFSARYDVDLTEMKQVGDRKRYPVALRLRPGEVDRFGITLAAKGISDKAPTWWRLQPILCTNLGDVSVPPIEVWLPRKARTDSP